VHASTKAKLQHIVYCNINKYIFTDNLTTWIQIQRRNKDSLIRWSKEDHPRM